MTTAKNEVFIGLKQESCYLVGGICWGEKSTCGEFLQVRDELIFSWWGDSPIPPLGKNLPLLSPGYVLS